MFWEQNKIPKNIWRLTLLLENKRKFISILIIKKKKLWEKNWVLTLDKEFWWNTNPNPLLCNSLCELYFQCSPCPLGGAASSITIHYNLIQRDPPTASSMSMHRVRFFSILLNSSFSCLYVSLQLVHSSLWFPCENNETKVKLKILLYWQSYSISVTVS